jgi:surface antigen
MLRHKYQLVLLSFLSLSLLSASLIKPQSAKAGYMDDYFRNGMTIKLTTPQGFNINLPYAKNGGMINTFEPDKTNEWKFQVIRATADGIKLQRIGTNYLITAQKFPSTNLAPLEAYKDAGGEDKFQTWVAIPTKPGFFALCLKAQRNQCMNVPNSKNRTKLTTYQFNPNDPDQMFSVGILSQTPTTPPSTVSTSVNWESRAYRQDNPFWPNFAPASLGGYLNTQGNCTWYANGRLRELGYSAASLSKLLGNAEQWANQARAAGIPVGKTPQVGAIAQWDRNHVAVVEQVNNDGTIVISESSYSPVAGPIDFLYKQRTIAASDPSNYIYVPRQ